VETAPRSDYVFWARGLFRVYAQSDAAGARKDAERTLALSPAYAPGYELRGLACLLTGEHEAAKENFAKAVSLSEFDPLLPYRLYLSAVASLCADRPAEAAESIEQAIQLRPNLRAFRKLQALCLRRSGDAEGAEKAEARAAKLPDAPSILAPRPRLADAQSEILQALAPSR
jgi:tetratricopeptide (TPR) repeat protein